MSNTRIKACTMDWRSMYTRVQMIVLITAIASISLLMCENNGLPKEKMPCHISRETVRETVSCPRNKAEWTMRAKEMKCQDQPQNCTSSEKFKYHCVLNVWGNATIELCAEERVIVGRKCTEFSYGGAFLQEHYENKCASCPYLYNSSDIYLYQECFQFPSVLSTKGNDENTTDKNNGTQHDQPLNTLPILIGIPSFIVVAVVIGCVTWWVYRSRCQKESTVVEEDGDLLEMEKRKESKHLGEEEERLEDNISSSVLGPAVRCYVRQLST